MRRARFAVPTLPLAETGAGLRCVGRIARDHVAGRSRSWWAAYVLAIGVCGATALRVIPRDRLPEGLALLVSTWVVGWLMSRAYQRNTARRHRAAALDDARRSIRTSWIAPRTGGYRPGGDFPSTAASESSPKPPRPPEGTGGVTPR